MQCEACGHYNIDGARFCAGCGVLLPVPKADDPLIGQTVGGRYRVTGVLGEGGMGVVYAAEQQMGSTVRKVAVKTLHAHLCQDPSVLARFHRECGTVAQLEHPNTIKFYDFGATPDGTLYIAMEFVNGKALSDVILEHGALPPARVLKIMRQVCGALDEAHEQGIIHRDLKPENIILTPLAGETDFVKVLDFGIAARSESADAKKEQKLTQQGMVLGTPPYMSPEQFTGKALDRKSDLYSLGVVAYEMLTGKLPFDADTPWQWATQHMTAQPTPFEVSAPRASIPDAMRGAILRALSKDPSARQATAKDFFSELSGGAAVATMDQIAHGPGSSATAAMAVMPNFGGPAGPPAATLATPSVQMPSAGAQGGGYVPHAPAMSPAMPYVPPPAPRARGGSGGKLLILALIGVGGLLALAIGVVAIVTLRPKDEPTEALANPVNSASATAATIAPVTDQAPLASASAPEEPVATKSPPTTVVRRTTGTTATGTTATGGKSSGGSVGGDPCKECVAQARSGNIQGAESYYARCTDAAQKQQCARQAGATAPDAVRRAGFNAQCAQAQAIVAAAARMGVGGPASNALKATSCR